MSLSLRVFPLLPGKELDFHRFCEELAGPRAEQARDFFGRFGVVRETWMLQHTASGSQIAVCSQVEQRLLERAADYGASQHEFDQWFKRQIESLSGIDVNQAPLGPPTELAFDWNRGRFSTRASALHPEIADD